MPWSGARRACLVLALTFGALAIPRRAVLAQQDSSLADLAFEVEVERGPARLLLALTRGRTVLLPVGPLFDLLEVGITESLFGRRIAGMLPGRKPFAIVTDSVPRLARQRETRPLVPGQALWRQGQLYLATDDLAWLLDVELTPDWSELAVRLARSDSLPVVQRLGRERRRGALLRARTEGPPPPILGMPRRLADGLVLDWATTSSTRRDGAGGFSAEFNTLQLDVGAAVLGGDLEIQHTRQRLPGRTIGETHWAWTGVWPQRVWLTQLRAGEVFSGGPRGRTVHGAAVTNSPFVRPAEFGGEQLIGHLPPGWGVELYRADQLVGYAPVDPAGRYVLDVPVIYGPNPLEVVAYGPRGEVVRRGRTFQVPFERLPAGRLEYSAGGGACPATATCSATVNADLRYGVSRRVTVEAGYDRFWRDTLSDLDHPYALASVAIARPVSVTVEGVWRAFATGRVDYDPHTDLHADVSVTRFDTSLAAPVLSSLTLRSQTTGSVFWRPAILSGDVFFQGVYVQGSGAGRRREVARLSATARVLGVRLSAGGEEERDRVEDAPEARRTGVDLAGDAILGGWGLVRGTFVRAALRAECAGAALACSTEPMRGSVGVGRQLFGAIRVDVGVSKERGRPGVGVDVGLTTVSPGLRASSRNGYSPDFGYSGTQLLEGSILYDLRSRRLGLDNGRSLGRAGFAGVVFLDLDGNGARDQDEPPLPGILLRVGSDAVVSDSSGRFAVWDLMPFEAAPLEVDTLALENPLWVPAVPVARIRPSPNSYRFVEVAIQQGAEVSGRAMFGDGDAPLGGARLLFTEVTTGAVRSVTTFGDGTFYAFGFRPGVYEVSLPATLAAEIRAQAAPVRFTVGGWGGTMRIENLVVRVQREER